MDNIEVKPWENTPYTTPFAVIVNGVIVCICPNKDFANEIKSSLEWAEDAMGVGFNLRRDE